MISVADGEVNNTICSPVAHSCIHTHTHTEVICLPTGALASWSHSRVSDLKLPVWVLFMFCHMPTCQSGVLRALSHLFHGATIMLCNCSFPKTVTCICAPRVILQALNPPRRRILLSVGAACKCSAANLMENVEDNQ